jgi:hypothetical protein
MHIRFTQGKNVDKPDVMTCIRDDGSWTLAREGRFMVGHDLLHYAVETTMGYQEAFFGPMASGRDIDSFGTRDGKKDTYTAEAVWTEFLVGSFQWSAATVPSPTDEECLATLHETCAVQGVEPLPITLEQYQSIRARARELHAAFDRLAPGESLELEF